jgi:hypothetical protein
MSCQAATNPAVPLQGQWAGDQLQFVLDPTGGRIETGCASGTLVGPIKLNADGKFVATGTFSPVMPGPQLADAPNTVQAARYSGELVGAVMKMTILPAGAQEAQVFNLREGAKIKLLRCL